MKISFDKGVVTPHPVFIISTYDIDGTSNAMNAAWAQQVDYDAISITLSRHNTTNNIIRNKEFCVAYATSDMIEACDYVGIVSKDKEKNKLEKAGFTVCKSEKVNAPIINELPLSIECRVIEVQEEFGDYRILAKIVGMVVDDKILTDGKIDYDKAHFVVFDSIGNTYREISNVVAPAFKIGKKLM